MHHLGPLLPVHWKRKGTFLEEWSSRKPEDLAELTKEWTENLGLRLDNYVSIDPDSPAALEIVNQWDADGLLPATVSWRTARGIVRRVYKPIPGTKRIKIEQIDLDLRHGPGCYDVIPPSYVVDDSKGIKGVYEWIEGHDPDSMDVAPLPAFVLEFFLEHSSPLYFKTTSSLVFKNTSTSITSICKNGATPCLLEEGNRDEGLFHIALNLFKGGSAYPEVEYIIRHLASICNPQPFPEKDALIKVESAYKRFQRTEKPLAAQVREWALVTSGDFTVTNCYQDLGVVTVGDKATVRQNLVRLTKEGLLAKSGKKSGCYRLIESEAPAIDFINADISQVYDIRFPFEIQNYVNIYPKNIIVIAGTSNAGKTAFLLNVVRRNMDRHKIEYFSSEMGPEEMKLRLLKFADLRLKDWKFHPRERSTKFADAIVPDAINIIDYLEVNKDFYEVGGDIKDIFDRLNKGVAFVAIQKKPGVDTGRGGDFTLEKPRLYLAMESGTIKIVKGKNWANNEINPNGMTWTFKLVDGCKFIETGGSLYDL